MEDELWDRLKRGLAALDNDFPTWLVSITGFTNDGLTLRFQDLEALGNIASKLRDRGVLERTDQRQAA